MDALAKYVEYVWSSISTILIGMGITAKYFFKSLFVGDFTMLYPEEKPVVSDRYRGIHILDVETCIGCLQCAKACPIDCISIRLDRNPETKEFIYHEFSVDYNKCMFCHLCIEPCPVDCIEMSRTYEFNTYNREDLVLDLRLPMHQYDAQGDGGTEKGREPNFNQAFNNTIFNWIKNPKEFEGDTWSRMDEKRDYQHDNPGTKLTGLNYGSGESSPPGPDSDNDNDNNKEQA